MLDRGDGRCSEVLQEVSLAVVDEEGVLGWLRMKEERKPEPLWLLSLGAEARGCFGGWYVFTRP